ncbi:MAG: MFS transporter [Deltaproteobacteria bacterium]|nr:MFS transporter [Deltaproteobacteria bacterium]MBI2180147.1 MFS transporter [Deltaproteobacteria bacterium]MBI2230867.1 MFS transporter [Deltaproteobacteria bacterium]MBI2535241.1 MFS transporter [Deltaproteobacteria bacterium]MBI3065867.1 MFS transporter [Deltaproteobacteria bacterium]
MQTPVAATAKARLPLSVPFFYGWVAVALSFLTTLVGAGVRSAPTVFIHPLEVEFGWSRAEIAFAVSINLFLYGLAGPLSGWLLDRFGSRRVMAGSLALMAVGVGLTTLMREYWQLLILWGVVIGVAAGGTASVLSATVANRWFVARRGVVLGVLNSANSTGQLIFLPLMMTVIVTVGWRGGSLLLLAATFAMIPLVALWMRDDPADIGLAPYGSTPVPASGGAGASAADSARVPLRAALKTSTFWLLAGSYFVCGATANGLVGTHLIPHAIDRGIPEITAAATVGVMGGLNFVGTTLSGWVIDYVAAKKWLALIYVLRALSLFILPFVTDFSGLFIFAVIYGLDWFATVAPTIAIASDTFGKRSVGIIYGWIFVFHQIGGAVAATAAGAVRVSLGEYHYAFLAGGLMALIAAGLALSIRSRPLPPPLPPRTEAARA